MTESDKARAWKKHNISNAEYDAGWERIFGQYKNGLKPCPKCGGDFDLVPTLDGMVTSCFHCSLESLKQKTIESMQKRWANREGKLNDA